MGTIPDCQKGVLKTDTLGLSDVMEKCIVIKRHRADNSWDDWNKDNTNLIFLLRDWREACLRHLTMEQRRNDDEIIKCTEGYIHCLRFYDQFGGNKLFVSYEDLIVKPLTQVTRILDFLSIEKGSTYNEFLENFEHHRRESIKAYAPGSSTFGVPQNLKYHVKMALPKLIKKIDNAVMQDRELYNKYLKNHA